MILKKLLLPILFLCSFISHKGVSQENKNLEKGTISYLIQRARVANLAPSYASLLPFYPSVGNRLIPLEQGEGSDSNFNLLEANLNLSFPLFFGQVDNLERSLITFDYRGNFRMTLDNSKPLTPGNQKFGLTFFTSLWNNHLSNCKCEKDSKRFPKQDKLRFVNFTLNAYHYSNGQAGNFFFFPDEINQPSLKRNNYKSGDFSTNYLNFIFTYGWYNSHGSLHQLSPGIRLDFGSTGDGALAFTKEQVNNYGKTRLHFTYDYRSPSGKSAIEYHLRGELGYIAGDMSEFQANLIDDEGNPDDKKYRLSLRLMNEISPKSHRAVGYFFSLYYGRDYLNIRYDDIIFTTQIGITLTFDKYRAPDPWNY